MKIEHLLSALCAVSLCAACGSEPEQSPADPAIADEAEAAGAGGIDTGDYGFLDAQVLAPIAMPDWFPDTITLPADFVAVEAREIGSSNLLVRGVTSEPLEGMYDTLANDLETAGYSLRKINGMREDNLISFKGMGYDDGAIRLRPGSSDTMLEITLTRAP